MKWHKKIKGTAIIYTHPSLNRAIVYNIWGIFFNGVEYSTLEKAKKAAFNV